MMRRFVHFRETDLEMIWHFVNILCFLLSYRTSDVCDTRLQIGGKVRGMWRVTPPLPPGPPFKATISQGVSLFLFCKDMLLKIVSMYSTPYLPHTNTADI